MGEGGWQQQNTDSFQGCRQHPVPPAVHLQTHPAAGQHLTQSMLQLRCRAGYRSFIMPLHCGLQVQTADSVKNCFVVMLQEMRSDATGDAMLTGMIQGVCKWSDSSTKANCFYTVLCRCYPPNICNGCTSMPAGWASRVLRLRQNDVLILLINSNHDTCKTVTGCVWGRGGGHVSNTACAWYDLIANLHMQMSTITMQRGAPCTTFIAEIT